jgi:molybdopterin converting factor small subunit
MPVKLPDGATVEQLVKHLRLPAAEIKVIFVNSVTQQKDHVLDDGDQVGIFPAVGGG